MFCLRNHSLLRLFSVMYGFPRRTGFRTTGTAVALLLAACALPALADMVVLRIRAGNPIETPQKVRIKSNLPARVSTNDIVNLSGLELGYDVKNDTYYVHKEVELGPNEVTIFDVEITDIWVVNEEELRALVKRTGGLVKMLAETVYLESAQSLQADISKSVESIRAHQAKKRIRLGVTPIQHIRAYETNLKVLTRVRKDVGRVENLVLASGQDPGALIGAARDAPPPRAPKIAPEDYKQALIRITVRNTSPTESRRININRELPEEITAADVIDGGGLEVGTDSKRSIAYVFKKDVQIGPNEMLTFDVKVRDKWNINLPRAALLRARITTIIGQIGEKDQYKSVDETLQGLLADLAKIKNESGPQKLSSAYVAFYRDQAIRLDGIEQKVHRIEAALRPVEKRVRRGFRIQPPSLKTTWLIIYVILGFLAIVSLLFFLRWMTKSKAESME